MEPNKDIKYYTIALFLEVVFIVVLYCLNLYSSKYLDIGARRVPDEITIGRISIFFFTVTDRIPELPAFFVRTGSLKRNHQHEQWRRKDAEERSISSNDGYLLQTGCYAYWGRYCYYTYLYYLHSGLKISLLNNAPN